MIFRWFFLFIFLAIASTMLYVSFYIGLFRSVEVAQEERPGFHAVYKLHLGPYHKINPVIEEVESWAHGLGWRCQISFGEYLDDPNETNEHHLRSHGGCVVPGPVEPEDLPEGFNYRYFPEGEFVVARFRGSPALGPMKVYPKAVRFIHQQNLEVAHEVIELYTNEGPEFETTYLFRILN